MKHTTLRALAATSLAALTLLSAGCASQRVQAPQPVAAAPRVQYGQVQNIEALRAERQASGGGALIGGVVGAVIGRQVGHGIDRAAATAVGALGGAIVGNQIEKNQNRNGGAVGWRVFVRFDNGSQRTFDYAQLDDLRIGDRVRVEGGQVYRY